LSRLPGEDFSPPAAEDEVNGREPFLFDQVTEKRVQSIRFRPHRPPTAAPFSAGEPPIVPMEVTFLPKSIHLVQDFSLALEKKLERDRAMDLLHDRDRAAVDGTNPFGKFPDIGNRGA